jgi:hypothetical protein
MDNTIHYWINNVERIEIKAAWGKEIKENVGFGVLTQVVMKSSAVWDM